MTREEAASIIEDRIRVTEYVDSSYVDCVDIEALRIAIKALAQPEPKWIPCSERLPDTNRDVLLQFGNSMGVGFWEHNSWGINTGDDIYSEIGEREAQPIAWRELPEPWKGEEDETD